MSIKEKLRSIIEKLLASSRIPKVYAPVISGLIENFMKEITDEELRVYTEALRDEFIPWLLAEEIDAQKVLDHAGSMQINEH